MYFLLLEYGEVKIYIRLNIKIIILSVYLDWGHPISLRRFLNSFQSITLSSDRGTDVQIIISVFEEATVFLIFTGFLSVGYSEKMVFVNKPMT